MRRSPEFRFDWLFKSRTLQTVTYHHIPLQVRRSPEFRFDWLFKSRTPVELGRRVDLLIRLIQNESKEPAARGSKKDKAAAERPSSAQGAGPSEE